MQRDDVHAGADIARLGGVAEFEPMTLPPVTGGPQRAQGCNHAGARRLPASGEALAGSELTPLTLRAGGERGLERPCFRTAGHPDISDGLGARGKRFSR